MIAINDRLFSFFQTLFDGCLHWRGFVEWVVFDQDGFDRVWQVDIAAFEAEVIAATEQDCRRHMHLSGTGCVRSIASALDDYGMVTDFVGCL